MTKLLTYVRPVKAADSMDALVDELQKAVSDPADVIKAGFAPVPYCFGFQPSSKHADQVQAFSGLLGMSAITRMFASINLITGRQAKKITAVPSLKDPEEYVDGFNEQAEAAIKSVTAGPLTQIYNSSENNITRTEEQQLKRSDIHNFVLPRIFGGVPGITKAHMTQLDTVLTDLVTALKPLTVTPTDTQPVIKQVIFINYVNATDITGTGDVFVIEPICRMVTLTLQSDEWTNALLKPGFLKKNEKINFGMTTTTMNMKMDATKWAASKSRYEQVVKTAVSDEPALKKILDNGGIEGFGRATCMVLSLDPVKPSDD